MDATILDSTTTADITRSIPKAAVSRSIVNPTIQLVKHVALFEDRHVVPSWVHDFIFEKRAEGWDTLDIWEFQRVALQRLLRWKYEGIGTIYVYLSGLTTAVISAVNAAYKAGIYVKLFHYSYMIDKWLPQNLDFLDAPPGVVNTLTAAELKQWNLDRELKAQLTDKEYGDFRYYVKIFLDLRDKYRDTTVDWGMLRKQLSNTIKYPRMDFIDLMRPFLAPINYEELQDIKGESYNDTLRNYIIQTRRRTDPTPTSINTRKERQTTNSTIPAKKGNSELQQGYCTRPTLKKYKKQRKH